MTSSSKQLLLVTYQFPFDSGETFVADELAVLSKYFDRIYIMPARACFNRSWLNRIRHVKPPRLPAGCQVILPTTSAWSAGWRSVGWLARLLTATAGSYWPRLNRFAAIRDLIRDSFKTALFLSKRPAEVFQQLGLHPDLKLAYCYWKTEAATALSLLKQLNPAGFELVCRCHGGDLYYNLPHRPNRPFDPLVASQARLVMPVSDTGAAHLREHGFPGERVEVQRLGIELPERVANPSVDGLWRIVSCSNVIPIKRVGLIVQSLSLLKQPFEWTHFGDGKEMERVQALTKQLPAHGQFCLRGARPRQEIFDYYQQQPIDLFLNLSITEGVPVSVMEALSYGIPVIATDAGGTRELVDSQVGALIPIAVAAEEVAAAIVLVLSTSPASFRLAARKRAQQLCDGQKNYARFAERLLDLNQKPPNESAQFAFADTDDR